MLACIPERVSVYVPSPLSDSSQFILNNGQTMPAVSFGFEIYGDDTAEELMGIALDQGVRNFFASVLASNQPGVGRKIATMEREHGVTREEIFLCGSVTQCRSSMTDQACYEYTANMAAQNLHDLGVDYLDQIMLDYPPSSSCDDNTCMLIKAQVRQAVPLLQFDTRRSSVRERKNCGIVSLFAGVSCSLACLPTSGGLLQTCLSAERRLGSLLATTAPATSTASSTTPTLLWFRSSISSSEHCSSCARVTKRVAADAPRNRFRRANSTVGKGSVLTVSVVFCRAFESRYHIGMGADPHDMIADNYARGVIPQA